MENDRSAHISAEESMAARINLSAMFCLTFLLEPKLFTKFPILNQLYILGAVLVFMLVLNRLIKNHITMSKFLILALLYRLAMLPQTILQNGQILDWGYYTLTLLALIGYFRSMQNKEERLTAVDNVAYLLFLYLCLNLIILLVAPKGVVDGLYFLGYRTRIVEVLITAVTASSYVDCYRHKLSIRTVMTVLIGLVQIMALWVATAIVGIGIFLVSFLVFRRSTQLCKPVIFNMITALGIVFTIAFCMFGASSFFSGFIQSALHKTATLSDRTSIWTLAIQMIRKSPLFGYGVVDNGNHIFWVTSWSASYWQAHNNILQILLDGGILCFIPYLAMLLNVGAELRKSHISGIVLAIVLSAWLAFNVMAVSEIFVLQNYYFLFLVISLSACIDYSEPYNGNRPEATHEV